LPWINFTVNTSGSPLVLAVIECAGDVFGMTHTVPVAIVPPGVSVPAISGTGAYQPLTRDTHWCCTQDSREKVLHVVPRCAPLSSFSEAMY
jgi:hypothetical protein